MKSTPGVNKADIHKNIIVCLLKQELSYSFYRNAVLLFNCHSCDRDKDTSIDVVPKYILTSGFVAFFLSYQFDEVGRIQFLTEGQYEVKSISAFDSSNNIV